MPRSSPPALNGANSQAAASVVLAPPALFGVCGCLIVARYLEPTEGAAFGETLWQSLSWLVMAAVWAVLSTRRRESSWQLAKSDGWFALLAVGHAIATLRIFWAGGDRRSAVNMVWEWIGLLAALFVLRQMARISGWGAWLRTAVLAIASVGCLGLWQAHVTLPRMAEQYNAMAAEESSLQDKQQQASLSASEKDRLRALDEEFVAMGRPADPITRRRFEDRLRGSSEPIGFYGLANTFAGLLIVALPFLLGLSIRGSSFRTRLTAGVIAGVLAYVLILTKSRTAWVGLIAGGGVELCAIAWRAWRFDRLAAGAGTPVQGSRWFVPGAIASGLAFAIVAIAASQLDWETLSQAPRSLRFRLEYWLGTSRVLAEHPVLGTGPANFRFYYLEHRLPGASEAIASPHNLFLDVWVAGGLLSLAGLLGWLTVIARHMIAQRFSAQAVPTSNRLAKNDQSNAASSTIERGGMFAFPLVLLLGWIGGEGWDLRLIAVGVLFAAMVRWIPRYENPGLPAGIAGATVALLVHLLGADGIEFPAIAQTLVLLAAVLCSANAVASPTGKWRWAPAAVFCGLAAACLVFGFVPWANSRAFVERANVLAATREPGVERTLESAAQADPWSLDPLWLRADYLTTQAMETKSRRDSAAAVSAWEQLLAADPRHVEARRQLAALLSARDTVDARRRAGELLKAAVLLSPTDIGLRADVAQRLDALGDLEAVMHAEAALTLDAVNHQRGHEDLYLPAAQVDRLQAIVSRRERPFDQQPPTIGRSAG